MLLLVGLGNPGKKYAANRHNVGFMAADAVQSRYRFAAWRTRFDGELSEGAIGEERVLLVKPMTFMNDSGRTVGYAANFYKIKPKDVIVMHDELDLAFGKVRAKTGGGLAGHNGLRSISQHLGGPDFRRVRIGIDHPGHKELVHGHVLSDFSSEESSAVERIVAAIAEAVPYLMTNDEAGFATKVALLTKEKD
jgi:PTH1 family peptidyl-tRNA hydrolase